MTSLLSHALRAPRRDNLVQPEVEFAKADAQWWRVPQYDSVLVSAADGSGKNVYTRDRAQYRKLLKDSIALHRRLRREWPALVKQYRAEAARLSSQSAWKSTFEGQS